MLVSKVLRQCTSPTFRTTYEYNDVINWFPGHMVKAANKISARLKTCDLVLEIRDARIPLSCENKILEAVMANKKRIIIFNKIDLADPSTRQNVEKYFKQQNQTFLFTEARSTKSVKSIVEKVISGMPPKVAKNGVTSPSYLLVLGMPNVGKSTLINQIKTICVKGSKVAKTGAMPGVTRGVTGFRVSDSPPVYLVDSPGVLLPKLEQSENEKGLRLALTGAIRETGVPVDVVADYLLYTLNRFKSTSYVTAYQLPGPSDSIEVVLKQIAERLKAKTSEGNWDTHKAASHFIAKYRNGELGKFTLDEIKQT